MTRAFVFQAPVPDLRDMSQSMHAIRNVLETRDNFLVSSHEHPDGDALGSSVALGFLLQRLGRNFRIYNGSGVPEHFSWLPLPAPVYASLHDMDFTPEWVIVCDCGDPFRMGKELLKAVEPKTIINIDHHVNNPMFGALNWVDTNMSAVGEMVALLARSMNIPLEGGLGEAVYLAIVSDTGNFSYGNTKPEVLELAAEILRLGLDVEAFNAKYMHQWPFRRLKLWSEVLGEVRLHLEDRVGVVRIPRATLSRHGAGNEDCDGLVEFVRKVKTVRVSMALREDKDGLVKFSLRSQGKDDVQQVALHFDGGGHRNAAGGSIAGGLDLAESQLLEAISLMMHFNSSPVGKDGRRD